MTKTTTFLRLTPALVIFLFLAPVNTAFAYIGPGAGISVVGSLLTVLVTFFVAIGAIIFWPVRKFLKRRKARRNAVVGADTENAASVSAVADNKSDGS